MANQEQRGERSRGREGQGQAAAAVQGDAAERRLHADGLRRRRPANCICHEPGKGHAGHAAGSPRGHGRLRHLHARSGGGEGRTGDRHRAQAPAPACSARWRRRRRYRAQCGMFRAGEPHANEGRSMIAQELEVSLHMAFVEARQKQHEFITVEHLLLAMLDNPSAAEVLKACGVDLDELRGVLADFIQRAHAAPAPALGRRHAADAGLPARDPARDPARPVVGQEGSHRRQRAGGDLRREGIARRLFPEPAWRHPPRRRQLHRARHHQDAAAEAGEAGEPRARTRAAASRRVRSTPTRINLNAHGEGRQDRSADRPRARARARDPGAVPPPQEQSAAGRRSRRGQDRDRRRARAPHQRRRRARAPARSTRSIRSTWARCSPAPSTAATSSSA